MSFLSRRALCALWIFCLGHGTASAQAFFANIATDPATGVEKGSVSSILSFPKPTGFATFSSIGSRPIGPYVSALGYSIPNVLGHGDQVDVLGVLAGPSDIGGLELGAGGLGYRFDLGNGLTLRSNADYGHYSLGTSDLLPLQIKGSVANLSFGARKVWTLGADHRLTGTLEVAGQATRGQTLGVATVDENLRFIRIAAIEEYGRLFGFQRRLAVSITKGVAAFGASPVSNPAASVSGATSRFLRVAFSAEASFPLKGAFLLNAGVVGQWTDDSLPLTQRCGYGTNAYSRGFDQGYVLGDRCLGSRLELAYDFHRPSPGDHGLTLTEGFVGLDRGVTEDNPNSFSPRSHDGWSSLSIGIRTLRGNFLGEIALTRILDLPAGSTPQDRTRLWLQSAIRF